MRDRLIELLEDTLQEWECDVSERTISQIAEHLFENGVIVLPCKVGDIVYRVYDFNEKIIEALKVLEITTDIEGIKTIYASTKTGSVFCFTRNDNLNQIKFTKEEAEKALRGVQE